MFRGLKGDPPAQQSEIFEFIVQRGMDERLFFGFEVIS